MKNFTLFLLIIGMAASFSLSSNAQTKDLKGSGEVFYHTTFDWGNPDDPKGWTADEGFYFEDPLDNGCNWHWWPNDSLNAILVKEPPFRSSSPEDGHLCLFAGLYNDYTTVVAELTAIYHSVVFPPFDCSDHSSVIVRYETHFMAYSQSSGMQMLVSNDAGVHWAAYPAGFGCGHKQRPNAAAPGEAVIFEANITDVAAGMSEVIIKFHWANSGIYFWLIDDFELAEAYNNDLIMKHFTMEWDDGDDGTIESYSHNLPISQIGGALTNFEAAMVNFGEFDQYGVHLNVDITKNSQSIWNQSTGTDYLPVLLLDTIKVEEPFTPTEFGHYKVTWDLRQEEEEQSPENDIAEAFFNITDSIYSRGDDTAEESFVWGLDAYGTEGEPNEQHFVGNIYPIYGDTEVEAISAFVTGGLADEEIEFRMAMYWLPPADEEDQTPVELLVSEIVTLDSSMHNTWVTLPLEKDGESEFLISGDIVYAGVEYWNWHVEQLPYKRYLNFAIGGDRSVKVKDPSSIVRAGVEAGFGQGITNGAILMTRLLLNDHSNATDGVDLSTAMSSLEQNYPNPVNGSTEITYELANSSGVIIEVTDMTGRTVLQFNEGNKPAGKHSMQISTTSLEAGVYFYTLKAGNFVDTKRMIVSE